MLEINNSQIKQYEADLKVFNERAFPFATRFTVHMTSKRAAELGRARARRVMTMRNKWSEGSIQFEPRTANRMSLNVRRQVAFTGSTEEYMAKQEFGGTTVARGKEGVPIPTAWAANQEGAQPRTKLPLSSRSLRKITLPHSRIRARNRKQRNVIAVQHAIKTNRRYAYFEFARSKGIYRVIGGNRRSLGRGWPTGVRVKMAYDMSRKVTPVPQNAWLRPATFEVTREIPNFYRDALMFQLKRAGLFGG